MPTEPLPPPNVHPDEPPFVCIQINPVWIPYIIGLLWPARFPEYWAGTLEENRQARRDIQNLINQLQELGECTDMTNCCQPLYVETRINVSTGQIEVSYDGGTTWTPAPGSFPTQIIEQPPPVNTGVAGTKCDAATNAMAQIQGWIDHVEIAFDVAAGLLDFAILVASAILDAILLILSEGALTAAEAQIIAIITGVLTGVWEGGKALFSDYWSPDVKDSILCDMFCTIGEDGAWTNDSFIECRRRFSQHMPSGLAKTLFLGFMSSVGRQGWNNMAASGASADADCSDCTCPEACDISTWHILSPGYGAINPANRTATYAEITAQLRGDGKYYAVFVAVVSDSCCEIDSHAEEPNTIKVIEGTANFSAYTGCGEDQNNILLANHPLGFGAFTINGFYYRGDVPFKLRFDTSVHG